MKLAGFTARELRIAEYSEEQLVEAGFSTASIRLAGYGNVTWTFGQFTYESIFAEEDLKESSGERTEREAQHEASVSLSSHLKRLSGDFFPNGFSFGQWELIGAGAPGAAPGEERFD